MIGFLTALAVHTSDIKQVWTDYAQEEVKALEMKATFYTADCEGCIGIVKSGYNVKNTIYYEGKRIIAADYSIPLYTEFEVKLEDGEKFNAIVLDRGGMIKGDRIDILVEDYNTAIKKGRQKAFLKRKE